MMVVSFWTAGGGILSVSGKCRCKERVSEEEEEGVTTTGEGEDMLMGGTDNRGEPSELRRVDGGGVMLVSMAGGRSPETVLE